MNALPTGSRLYIDANATCVKVEARYVLRPPRCDYSERIMTLAYEKEFAEQAIKGAHRRTLYALKNVSEPRDCVPDRSTGRIGAENTQQRLADR